MADLQGSAFFIIFNETNQKMKPKTPFTVFFELHPEFPDATREAFLRIERNAIETAYYLGKLQSDSGKSEQQYFENFYENH